LSLLGLLSLLQVTAPL